MAAPHPTPRAPIVLPSMGPKSDEASAADSNDSPLLNLPAELRNSIYEFVFEDQGRVFTFVKGAQGKAPGLLMACRQTYGEGINMYYHGSVLYVANGFKMRYIAAGTQHLPPKLIANIRHILLSCASAEALGRAKHGRYASYRRLDVATYAEKDLELLHRFLELSNAGDALIRKVRYEIVGPGRERIFTSTPVETTKQIERKWHDQGATELTHIDGQEESIIGPWKILELDEKTSTDEGAT